MIGCQILQYTIVQWELRGATSLVSFVLILIALGMVRSSCPNALESRINEKAAR